MPNRTDIPLENIRENMIRLMLARGFVHMHGKDKGKPNRRALALEAKVDPKTVGNLLNPEWKQSPVLDKVADIANALGVATWQLCMPNLPLDKDANDLLRSGIEDDVYQLAAAYQIMQPEARERVRAVLGFVTAHPDAISANDLLRAAKRAG